MTHPVLSRRRAGILLHPTSLPATASEVGRELLGTLGPEAYRFVDFLQAAQISVWQVLPLGPTLDDLSPYMSTSVHAGNPHLISLDLLREWGWLDDGGVPDHTSRQVRLDIAHEGFEARASEHDRQEYGEFCERHRAWLDDYATYQALRHDFQRKPWFQWPQALRDRDPQALSETCERLRPCIEQVRFEQFVFFRQWLSLKHYANERGIDLFGDMPIFVSHDSADVWAHREYFDLDADGRPITIAGVPPDYFSATGQRWGNPHYRWGRMAEDGYLWWIKRMRTALELFDLVRIDHFRGFEAYWSIPGDAETAIEGRWVPGPGNALFKALQAAFPYLPVVAEDLGVITPEVEALREYWNFPGMKILQFAFDGSADNPYLPHNHRNNAVVYTGTHDNDTTPGWVQQLGDGSKHYICDYLGCNAASLPWGLIRAAVASTARLAVVPLQDFLGLGSEARMNVPGEQEGNWRWRFAWGEVPEDLHGRIRHLLRLYGRAPQG